MSTSGVSGDAGSKGFSVTTPAVPATTVAVKNTNPFSCEIYLLTAGTGTAFVITDALGTSKTFTVTLTVGDLTNLAPGESIALTYSAAPTWVWKGSPPF